MTILYRGLWRAGRCCEASVRGVASHRSTHADEFWACCALSCSQLPAAAVFHEFIVLGGLASLSWYPLCLVCAFTGHKPRLMKLKFQPLSPALRTC